jgi:hypothetical protein
LKEIGLEDNIKIDLKELGLEGVDWIYLVRARDKIISSINAACFGP